MVPSVVAGMARAASRSSPHRPDILPAVACRRTERIQRLWIAGKSSCRTGGAIHNRAWRERGAPYLVDSAISTASFLGCLNRSAVSSFHLRLADGILRRLRLARWC